MDQQKPPAPEKPAKAAGTTLSPQKQAQNQRLAEALRANLRRRKAQVRQRKAESDGEAGP
jgi:hypothetical protein